MHNQQLYMIQSNYFILFLGKNVVEVHVQTRLDVLKTIGKQPLIYHSLNISHPYSTLNIEIKPLLEETIITESLFILVRYGKLPILTDCDFAQSLSTFKKTGSNT